MPDSLNKLREVLDKARQYHIDGEYPLALENCEYFFDHALDDDPASLYGVRLSFCLSEWARLGEKFPKAKEKLIIRKSQALQMFYDANEVEKFHDFVAICKYLECKDEPIDAFMKLKAKDPEKAEPLLRFIWKDLIDLKHWELCNEFLQDSEDNYKDNIMKFDRTQKLSNENPKFGGEGFEEHMSRIYVNDCLNIINVLLNNGRKQDVMKLKEIIYSDMEKRNKQKLADEIFKQVGI